MGNVTVKPLEWGKTSYGSPEALTVVGVYRLNEAWSGGWSVTIQRDVLRDSDGCTNFATIEAAKAAAQRDYEARILSALAVPTVQEPDTWLFKLSDGQYWQCTNDKAHAERLMADSNAKWIVEPRYARPVAALEPSLISDVLALSPAHLADALDAFWNAAIGSMRDGTYHMVDNTVPTVVVNSIAAGVAAVAEQLRK